jgi:tyrosine aminotransferase
VLFYILGDNILVPKPGFPLYQVISESLGASVRQYPLLPETSWSCDLEQMEKLIDSRTKAILINNPSNPCGSNFTGSHLEDISAIARRHGLLIIADEIYGRLVFDGEFAPCHVYSGDVPVISVSGIELFLVR